MQEYQLKVKYNREQQQHNDLVGGKWRSLLGDYAIMLAYTYSTVSSGMGPFKPTNILFLYHAINSQKGLSFRLKWKGLELLTRVMLSSGASLMDQYRVRENLKPPPPQIDGICRHCIVLNADGVREDGWYHNMKLDEFQSVVGSSPPTSLPGVGTAVLPTCLVAQHTILVTQNLEPL